MINTIFRYDSDNMLKLKLSYKIKDNLYLKIIIDSLENNMIYFELLQTKDYINDEYVYSSCVNGEFNIAVRNVEYVLNMFNFKKVKQMFKNDVNYILGV